MTAHDQPPQRTHDQQDHRTSVVLTLDDFERMRLAARDADIIRRFFLDQTLGECGRPHGLDRIEVGEVLSGYRIDPNRTDIADLRRELAGIAADPCSHDLRKQEDPG